MTITISPNSVAPVNNVYDLGSNSTNDTVTDASASSDTPAFGIFWTYAGNDIFNFTGDLALGTHIVYGGSGSDTVNGGGGFETVYDGAGNDVSHLGGANDTLYAGSGNDTYDGGAGARDTILFNYAAESSAKGDTRLATNKVGVTVSLSKTTAQTTVFGTDKITGFENLTGGDGADKLTGSSLANELSGLGGNDTISGLGGKDVLRDGNGKDILIGGKGADEIHVSSESTSMLDKVRYIAGTDSTLTSFDTIYGFKGGGASTSDRIDLSALLGSKSFVYHGTGAITTAAAGEVRWQLVNDTINGGKDIVVFVDTDADKAAEMKIVIDGDSSGLTALVKGDFIL